MLLSCMLPCPSLAHDIEINRSAAAPSAAGVQKRLPERPLPCSKPPPHLLKRRPRLTLSRIRLPVDTNRWPSGIPTVVPRRRTSPPTNLAQNGTSGHVDCPDTNSFHDRRWGQSP